MQQTKQLTTPARRIAWLVGGDLIIFVIFSVLGRNSHGKAAGLAAVLEVLSVAAPFAIGWLIIAPWLGAYKQDATSTPLRMLRVTALAWLLALPLGLLLRAGMIGRFSPVSFAVVTFLVNLVLLGGWRSAFAWFEQRGK